MVGFDREEETEYGLRLKEVDFEYRLSRRKRIITHAGGGSGSGPTPPSDEPAQGKTMATPGVDYDPIQVKEAQGAVYEDQPLSPTAGGGRPRLCQHNFAKDVAIMSLIRDDPKSVHYYGRGADSQSWIYTPEEVERFYRRCDLLLES